MGIPSALTLSWRPLPAASILALAVVTSGCHRPQSARSLPAPAHPAVPAPVPAPSRAPEPAPAPPPAPAAAPEGPLVEVTAVNPGIRVDLRYARADNAFHRQLYPAAVALLQPRVAQRLARVERRLSAMGLGLKVWDAYRPRSAQWTMWNLRPDPRYLSRPWKGSNHSRGAAVDVTLVDAAGRELPMPTPHDEFSPRAHRGAVAGVSPQARRNASLLDQAMRAEGFIPNRNEWWHFDAPEAHRYPLLDVPVGR